MKVGIRKAGNTEWLCTQFVLVCGCLVAVVDFQGKTCSSRQKTLKV